MDLSRFSSINFTPDLTIIAIMVVIVVYGLLLGRNKVKTLALSVYVGLVVSSELGSSAHQVLAGRGWDLSGRLSLNVVQLSLFVLPLLILELGRREHAGRGSRHGGAIMTIILSVLTAALVVSSGLKLLSDDTARQFLDASWLATTIYALRLWWIGLVPLAVIGENFIRAKEPHH